MIYEEIKKGDIIVFNCNDRMVSFDLITMTRANERVKRVLTRENTSN